MAPMSRSSRARIRVAALACALTLFAGCRNPQADAYVAEQLQALGDEVNAARQQEADMQGQIDSLRMVVARQDTLLNQLASMAGLPPRQNLR